MAVEQAASVAGLVSLTYQLPVRPVRVSVAVVSATALAASLRVVKVSLATWVEQPESL